MKITQLFTGCMLLLLLITPFNLAAQHKYIPFPDSNAIWVVSFLGENGQETGGNQTFIQKDTIIKGISYKKMVITEDSNLITPPTSHESWFAVRNDTIAKRVYIYDEIHGGGGQEWLLYDFSVQVGDTISDSALFVYQEAVITDIDTIMIDTNEHLVYYAKSKGGTELMPYIEGIGGTAGLIYPPWFFEGGSQLICQMLGKDRQPYYTVPGEVCKLYHYTGIKKNVGKDAKAFIYPHPVTIKSILKLRKEGDVIDYFTIYDHMGRIVFQGENMNDEKIQLGLLMEYSGIYFYRLVTRKGDVHTGKFICP